MGALRGGRVVATTLGGPGIFAGQSAQSTPGNKATRSAAEHPGSGHAAISLRSRTPHGDSNPIAFLARASVGAASSCALPAPSRAIAMTMPGSAQMSA